MDTKQVGTVKALLLLLVVVSVELEAAQVFTAARAPSTNLVPLIIGETVGVFGGIPTRTTEVDVTQAPYSVDNTGATEASTGIQAALNAAASNSVVYMPAGTYKTAANLFVPSYVTLRGAGPELTTIVPEAAVNTAVVIGAGDTYQMAFPTATNWVSGITGRGVTNLTQVATATDVPVGSICDIIYGMDTNLVFSPGGGIEVESASGFLERQMVIVHAASGNSLTVWPPMYKGTNATINQKARLVRLIAPKKYAGLESFSINSSNQTSGNNILMIESYSCWISNVVAKGCFNYGLSMEKCLFAEVRNCVISDKDNTLGQSNGAGILFNNVSASLIENNVIANNFPLIEVNSGSSGNAWGYNFLYDSRSGDAAGGSAMLINHGPHNEFDLYEGNMAPNIISDGYSGGQSHTVIHRNWFYGIQPGLTNQFQVSLKRGSYYFSLEGNIVGLAYSSQYSEWLNAFVGEPNIGGSTFLGTASRMTGDTWTNMYNSGIITNRTSDNLTEVHVLNPIGLYGIGNNLAPPGDQPTWQATTLTWVGVYEMGYAWLTNATANNFQLRRQVGYEAPTYTAYPANGTAVRFWVGQGGFQESDLDVSNTVVVANNYLFPDGIIAGEVVSGSTNSYYRTSKPSFFPSSYTWPPISSASVQTDMNLTNHVLLPAQYRWLNGSWPTLADSNTPVTNAPPRFRGFRFR